MSVSLSRLTYALASNFTFTDERITERRFVSVRNAWRAAALDYVAGDTGEDPADVAHVVERLLSRARLGDGFDGALDLETGETITVYPVKAPDALPVGELNTFAEFDCPFTVWPGGAVTAGPRDVYAPDVWDDVAPDGWEFVDGYSLQDRYSGPTMHASEYLGGRMARDVLSEPGTYVVTYSHATCEEDHAHTGELEPSDVPADFPVRPLDAPEPITHDVSTCGECGLSWHDDVPTSYTPAPAGRCPFEAFHVDYVADDCDDVAGWVLLRKA